MAGNEWINGYLEAILDSGAAAIEEQKPTVDLRERGHFNPTKYFVEEVVTGVDETDLHRTWIKVVATRNARERSSRLENMCWRIWHLTRKKKQVPPLSFYHYYLSILFNIYVHICICMCVCVCTRPHEKLLKLWLPFLSFKMQISKDMLRVFCL